MKKSNSHDALSAKARDVLAAAFRPPWLWLIVAAFLVASAFYLRNEGRPWWCACREFFLWSGVVKSEHNSQHLVDPYSFTHELHGVLLYGAAAWWLPKLAGSQRLALTIFVETAWELLENSQFIIERYRATNIALGYEGDSVVNTLGDIACCIAGFALARPLGLKGSIALCAVTELVLLLWIRDSLLLSTLTLIYPFETIGAWQEGN